MMKVSSPLPRIRGDWILFAAALLAQTAAATPDPAHALRGVCDTVFYATSTLEDFSGTVANVAFTGSAISVDGNATWSFAVEPAVAEMTTHHTKRDGNMRKMFEAAIFPSISCKVDKASLADMKPDGEQSGTIPLDLTIREVTKRIDGEVANWQNKDGKITFDCAFDISLKSYTLKPHSLLGVLRVGDKVHVVVKVNLERGPETGGGDIHN